MSTKSKLIDNNQKLNSNNIKLMAIKNAFMRPLPQYNGSSTPTTGIDTSDANATQSDILLNKTAYVKGTKLIGTHVCEVDSINDLLDEQDGYVTQLKEVSDDVSNLALNGLVDGTPRGSFQTLELLQTAYPDGAPGIYVITKTGEWCYYNEGWKIGGNYIGHDITSNIKITGNKDDILGTTEHNKLCILSDASSLAIKVVDKIEGGIEEISTLSEVLPQGIQSACCSVYDDNIYIFGGSNRNTIYKFNCSNEEISTLSVTLPQLLESSCCARHGDNIYIFGGYNGGNYSNTIYKFNCSNKTITTLSVTLPQGLSFACCATCEENIYIFGGYNGTNILKTIYKFDCTNKTITTLSVTLPQELYRSCCSVYGDDIYIFGGYGSNGIYKFNCATETLSKLSATLPTKIRNACCSIYNDNIYIFGGKSDNILNTILTFNCTNETISTLSITLPQALDSACCSIYVDNIYIFGGNNGSSIVNTIYNFSITFDIPTNNVLIYNANSKYSFDLITDQVTIPIKKVYIGDSNNTAQLANAYLYDETQTCWVNVNTGEVLS